MTIANTFRFASKGDVGSITSSMWTVLSLINILLLSKRCELSLRLRLPPRGTGNCASLLQVANHLRLPRLTHALAAKGASSEHLQLSVIHGQRLDSSLSGHSCPPPSSSSFLSSTVQSSDYISPRPASSHFLDTAVACPADKESYGLKISASRSTRVDRFCLMIHTCRCAPASLSRRRRHGSQRCSFNVAMFSAGSTAYRVLHTADVTATKRVFTSTPVEQSPT
ncbi:hypothetical protein BCR34DRAFT_206761 [Clohesyomyces aquaticus]|uniref:Uncharacterized protein n=1 Tax=Clohesyomyces aquaticus TaxID=1231657 RepID=A0A1Y2A9J5_9PLEO|nr:hypothetical protein BCR34DRAFT_206761 [Clohesyomyces aquaticus]